MTRKFPICPDRIRTIPEQFSWVDHRLVRERHIDLLTHEAAALYLFLATVADAQGLSYYSDLSLCQRLRMDQPMLCQARACLKQARLIAYKKPIYQVLAIGEVRSSGTTSEGPVPISEIFRRLKLAGGVS